MARPKKTRTVPEIQSQIDSLTKELNEAKAEARAKEKAERDHKALVAGRLVVAELVENATGPLAAAFREVADMKLSKPGDRARFGLVSSAKH